MFGDSLVKALARRWYVTVLGLMLTTGLCVGVIVGMPPTYQARADVLLLPPKAKPGDNPFLGLSGLREVTEVLSRSLVDDQTVNEVLPAHSTGSYTADRDFTVDSPILLIVGKDATPNGAMEIMHRVTALAPARLAQLQADVGAPAGTRVTSDLLKVDQKPLVDRKQQVRTVIAVGVLGILVTLLAVALLENLARRRRGAPRRGRRGRATSSVIGQAAPHQQSRSAQPPPEESVPPLPHPDTSVTSSRVG